MADARPRGDAGPVYLDNAATTRPRAEVAEAVMRTFQREFGNPASIHSLGLAAERLVKEARQSLADALHVPADRIIFTSGGTEANNLALRGTVAAYRRRGRHLITTAIEHPSVLSTARALEQQGCRLTVVPVDGRGEVSPETVAAAVEPDTVLVSVMLVNNEIGSIQPVADIAAAVRERKPDVLIHVDAVQAFGKVPVQPQAWGIDLLTLSGHKIHGPKGTGALYVRSGVRLEPLLTGGEQEGGLRPGTHNVPGIVGFGTAARLMMAERETLTRRWRLLKEQLAEGVRQRIPGVHVNGPPPSAGAPHIINLSVEGVRGEVLVHALAERGIFVSTGSACSSRRTTASHVLQALGLPAERLEGALRISFGRDNTEADVARFVDALGEVVAQLRPVAAVRRRP